MDWVESWQKYIENWVAGGYKTPIVRWRFDSYYLKKESQDGKSM